MWSTTGVVENFWRIFGEVLRRNGHGPSVWTTTARYIWSDGHIYDIYGPSVWTATARTWCVVRYMFETPINVVVYDMCGRCLVWLCTRLGVPTYAVGACLDMREVWLHVAYASSHKPTIQAVGAWFGMPKPNQPMHSSLRPFCWCTEPSCPTVGSCLWRMFAPKHSSVLRSPRAAVF